MRSRACPDTRSQLAAIGALGGVLAGLFGIGGGIVFVPELVLFLGMGQLGFAVMLLVAAAQVVRQGGRGDDAPVSDAR